MEKSRCSRLCSPVDGQWSNYTSWSTWSKCDKTCGSGTKRRTRTRSCTDPRPKHGGKHCSGSSNDTESKSCNEKECPIDGEWSVYRPPSTWSSCSKTCNTGIRTRTRFRTCTNPAPKFGGKHCLGSSIRLESRSCKLRECPIDGKWADYRPWSSWSGCDKTCGNGFRTRTRTRTCTDPTPKYGGKLCPGSTDNRGLDSCKIRECPIDGKWADYRPWSAWSSCDKTCGNGFRTKTRTRTCTNPTPKYGGKLCPGSTIDKGFVSCKVRECPIDGNWTPYIVTVNWTSCSTSCGAGTATRILFRSCSNPKPRYGGKNCVGNYRKKETKICEDRECPLQGEWTDYKLWSTWSNCDKTCGTGNKARIQTRKCTDPVPKNGGQQCQGPASRRETSSCKVRECPVDGNWTPYFVSVNWTCSVSCGEGTATRTLSRRCSNPKPQYGGKLCVGNEVKTETKICKDRQCPDKGEWSSVTSGGEWSECSQTCNKGTQTRTRTCKNSVSGNQGRSCLGESEKIETKACMIVKCPDSGWITFVASVLEPVSYRMGESWACVQDPSLLYSDLRGNHVNLWCRILKACRKIVNIGPHS